MRNSLKKRREDWTQVAAELAEALHRCGAPAHHLEEAVSALLDAASVSGAVAASPTALWLQVGDRTRVLRLRPSEVDLSRLGRLTELARWRREVVAEGHTPEQALKGLRRTLAAPPAWSARASAWALIASSAAGGALIGGTLTDALAGGLGGALTRHALAVLGRRPQWAPLGDGLVALMAGLYGGLSALAGASPQAVSLAAVLILLPGLSLTVSVTEIASGQWTSGGTRLLGVLSCLLQLAAGLAVGLHLSAGLPMLVEPMALPLWLEVIAPLSLPLAFAVRCGTSPKEALAVVLLGSLGFLVASGLGGLLGTAAGAVLIGLGAGASEQRGGGPALVLLVPAILLLVPGSIGLRGVDLLLEGEVVEGLGVALQALGTASVLAAAALVASALLRSTGPGRRPDAARGSTPLDTADAPTG